MTNANMTREGRYTGPSLQGDFEIFKTANKSIKAHYFVARPEPVKLDKNQQALIDLHIAGGIVAFGAWQTGTGNYKKARAIPVGAAVWTKEHAQNFSAYAGATTRPPVAPPHVCAWFAAHPRAQRCVALMEQK